MTKQTPTISFLVEKIDNILEPVRIKDRDGTSVCVPCYVLEALRDKLLAAEKMADALHEGFTDYVSDCGEPNDWENVKYHWTYKAKKALAAWEVK